MAKLKLKNSIAKTNYVQSLIAKGSLEIKELVNFENLKLNPQLTQDICQFIIKEIALGKFSKEDLDKSGIVVEILKQVFDLTDVEISVINDQITHILDNKLVKDSFFLKKGFTCIKGLLSSVKKA